MRYLEHLLDSPTAVMECVKCKRLYHVQLGETTQSDYAVNETDNLGRRTHPIGIEHQLKGLCGHWECARFKGLQGVHYR